MNLALVGFSQSPNKNFISVEVNKNIELLGAMYFLKYEGPELASSPGGFELNGRFIPRKEWYSFGWHIYNEYKVHAQNPHLVRATDLVINGIFLDYLSGLLIQLENFPNATMKENIDDRYFIRFSKNGDPIEAANNAGMFIESMNNLYRDLDFDKYFKTYEGQYQNMMNQVKVGLPSQDFIPAMEAFYQNSFYSYTLIPSLTLPTGIGFGPNFSDENGENIFNVFGPLWLQKFENLDSLDMGFGDSGRLRELSTHEFGHSFVNPVLDSMPKNLIRKTKSLFSPIKKKMTEQNYPNWEYCLDEHFVRAGEIIIARNLNNHEEAANLERDYINNRGFIYLSTIVNELENYHSNKLITYKEAVEKTMSKLLTIANN